jgi:pSer/pThr/pTyr-binding forkhead associated (FHA) protein/outer membrane biosynthesis protein TonB
MKKSQIELLQVPVEVCILRDGKPLMTQVFQHTPIRFGRILDNDIVLPFDGVSRHHCELRFSNGRWTLEDLKSLNGVQVNGERVTSATFDRLGEFELKPVTIQLKVVKNIAVSETASSATNTDETQPEIISATDETVVGPDPQQVASKRLHDEKPSSNRVDHVSPHYEPVAKKKPLLEVNGFALMGEPHALSEKAKARAVQVSILWHDVILSVDEFVPGEDMIVEINGIFLRLGRVGRDRSDLRCPTGTSFVDRPGTESSLLPTSPATWMADDGIKILARYVPKSRLAVSGLSHFIESELVDPLVVSGLVHGALAIATVTVTVKPPPPPKIQPERIAKIIATPIPVALPTPPPLVAKATPTPTPTPKPIAKATPPPPTPTPKPIARATPKPKVEKAVVKKVEPKKEPKVAQIPKPEKPIIERVAKADPPPKKVEAPPTPTPKPFNAASVGALKALSMLATAPASSTTNTDKIVVRKYASEDHGSSQSPTPTTSKMMSDLPVSNNSADNASVNGLALATGKNAGYGTGGFSGKTGKRGVMGSVIGGATYTEPTKSEGLTREQVMKVVQKHQIKIQQCYERSLMDDPAIAGRAEFEWEITAKGSVVANSVAVKETNLKNGEKLIDCVKGVFASMQFPSAKNGSTTTPTIGLPFGRL